MTDRHLSMEPASVGGLAVPRAIREETDACLSLSDYKQIEIVVLWSAPAGEKTQRVKKVWLPRQATGPGFFSIPEDELFRINKELFSIKQTLVAQVHTHPSHAFHSETDDEFATVSHEGAYSIVVPNFGTVSVSDYDNCAYFLRRGSNWMQLSRKEARVKILFED